MAAPHATVLVVDDEELNRDGLARRLQRHDYEVAVAKSGREAIELLGGRRFDLVLLDIMMPGMNGLEVLKFLRRVDSMVDLPIIMVTAKGESEDMVEALELGANDYVTKPLDFPVTLARIRTQLALRRAVAQVKELEGKLDAHNRELRAATEGLAAANDRHARDLEAAARVQRAFLPALPSEVSGARFAWAFQPCSQLAGDYLNVFRLGDGHAGLCVLDVEGHGVAAALLSVILSQLLTRVAGGPERGVVSPAEVVARLARELTPEATAGHTFSLLYGVLALDTGEFRFVSAGHPGPVHLTADRPPAKLEVTGFPVSVGGGAYREQVVPLKPGDRLILYSDGLTGVRNAEGEHFGTGRLLAALDEGRRLPLADALGGLVGAVEGWGGDVPRQDDISVLLVERGGGDAMTTTTHPQDRPPAAGARSDHTLGADIIIANAPDPVFVSDLEGKILQANDAVSRLLGFRRDEVIEQSLSRFISPEEAREFTAALKEVVAKGVTRDARLNPRSASGEVIPTTLNASALRDPDGRVIGAIGILRDMRELDKARAYAESLIKFAPDPVFVSDLEGKILQANDAVSRLLGFRPDELIEQSLSRFISPEETREFTAALKEVVAKGVTRDARLNPRSASGEVIPTTLNASVLRDPDGRVIGAIGILRDMRELDKARAYAESLIKFAPDPVFVSDLEGKILQANDAVSQLLGFRPDELIEQSLSKFISPEETREFTAALREVVAKGVTRDARLNPRSASGEVIPTTLNASALRDATGTVIGAIGILRDMRELDKARAYAESLIKFAPDPVFVSDLEGKILQANDAVSRLLGFRPDEVIEQSLSRFISPEETREFTAALKEVVAKGVTRDARLNPRSASGEVIPTTLNASALRDPDGRVIGAIGILRDMRELDKARAYAESLIKFAPDPVFVSDLEGKILQANDAVSQLLGFRPDELIEQSLSKFISPEETREFTAALKEVVAKGVTRDARLNPRSASGDTIPTTLNASALRDPHGRVIGAIGILRDMRELDKAREAAEIANRAKSQFLANMSHELRTPLNAIILYTELLRDEATDRNLVDFLPDLKKIHGAAKHLLALINDVLDLSRIESGKLELHPEVFDVEAMVRDVVTTIQPLAQKNANALEVHCPDGIGAMHADPTKVRQSLFNLLSNACKFTEGGTVRLEVGREAGGDWFAFRVIDTGIGMTPEHLSKLFKPFFQVDPSATRRFGGSGLGLAITRHFCEAMGGDIRVESKPGVGSTFTIRLPAAAGDTAPEAGPQLPSAAPARPRGDTVLVIDDDPGSREVLGQFLAKKGFRVEVAAGGEEGLALARKLRPLAITLDVVMPGMDGWSVLGALKADPDLADIPVVMVTMVDARSKGFRLGAADYLVKPVDPDRLTEVLRRHQRDPSARRALVVDDDPDLRRRVRGLLEKAGWAVDEAADGREALDRLAARPSLVLLDLLMPVVDGFEFLAEFRQRDESRSVPVIVLTAKDLTDDERDRLRGSVETVLRKGPLGSEQLLAEVGAAMAAAGRAG